MNLAYVMAPGRGDTDLLLHGTAERLIAEGFRPAGTAQINTDRADAGRCDMDVVVLPDGPTIRISQSLGLIVNKFGKHEAEGRGFRPLIAEALALDVPVLVGLNGLNENAFLAFSGGLAERLWPAEDGLHDWLRSRIQLDVAAA